MEKLQVFKVNEVFFGIIVEDAGIKMELREYFSFFIPNAKFNPKVKAKIWDGRIFLYDIRYSRLHIGLFWEFFKFCDDRKYKIEFLDNPRAEEYYGNLKDTVIPKKPDAEDIAILDSIPFVYNTPRDYQMKAVIQAISTKRQIILSPVGSGKSSMIYYLSLWHIQKNKSPVLILVPTIGLVAQMAKDFQIYAKGNLPEDFIYSIYAGQEKERIDHKKSPIVISTWQSVIAIQQKNNRSVSSGGYSLKEFLDPYKMIIVDEVHTAEAKSLTTILESSTESNYRFGFTGTLRESRSSELQLKGLIGNTYRTLHTHDLQQRKELANLQIDCHVLKYPDTIKQAFVKAKYDYKKEIDFILQSNLRNEYICRLALNQNGNTLILFQYVENHGKKIFEKLRMLCDSDDRKLFFISGSSPVKDREYMREIVETQKNAIITASVQVLATGTNIVNLENLIFASSTKSSIRVIQSIGRVLRISDTKQNAKVFDIIDDISWKSKRNFVLEHGLKRIETYIQEKFKYRLTNIDFTP